MGRINALLVVWILAVGWVYASAGFAQSRTDPFRVLLISSYHPGFPTFFQQIQGIKSVFAGRNILLDVEFMDKKRFAAPKNEAHFLASLSYKLGKIKPYDAVMTADDDALLFLLAHKAGLFPAQPVVFLGVNNITRAREQNARRDITGVIEAVSMEETIRLMLDLQPSARTVLALVDATPSSQGDLSTFRHLAAAFPGVQFAELSLADHSFAEFQAELRTIGPSTAVLLLSAYVDEAGERMQFEDSLRLILGSLRQPLFHLWYHGIGDGILGGKVISHEQQGKTAAELVVRILEGEPVENVKVIEESPNLTVVDYKVLKQFRLEETALPEDTVVFNRPFSLYDHYRYHIWGALGFLASQTALIAFLVQALRRKRKTETALRESEHRYASFFRNNHSVILIIHPKTGRIVDSNPAACAFYGYTHAEMVGRDIASINQLPPQDIQTEIEASRLQKRSRFLFTHRLASGELRDVEAYSGPITVNGEEVLCSIIHDITERKQAEQAVRERELFLAAILQTAADGFWVLDADGLVTEVNGAYCMMSGYAREELLGMPIGTLDIGASIEEEKARTDRIATRGWEMFETVHRRKDGSTVPLEVSCTHLGEDGGRFVHFGRDLTERKQAEEQLRAALERTQIILASVQLGLILIGNDNRVEFINRACCDLLGLTETPAELLGMTAVDLADKVVRACTEPEEALERIREIVARNALVRNEQVNLTGNRILLRDFVPLVVNGQPYGRLWYHYDISEQKRVEEERKKLREQLVQAQKMEAIGTLAGGIAHDFNNILSAVLGYAEMAKEVSPPGSEAARDLDMVMEAAQRAAALVRQILAFSRQGETKRIRLEPALMVKEAVKLLRSTIPSTITIDTRLEGDDMVVVADPVQMHQVVMNLCTNAYHAMEQTGGTIVIELRACELAAADLLSRPGVKPGRFVRLTVSDTGPGIPMEIRDKIFEPYFTTKGVGKGTGLGLAIVHGIASTAGGFAVSEGRPGEGATFHVYFPAAEKEVMLTAKVEPASLTGRGRLLFVDDEALLADMGRAMLERLGYEVTVFTSSLEALATFQNEPDAFDAVVTDQTMPGLTGVDLARRMLRIRPDLPIVLCTGFSNLVNEEQAKQLGIQGFIMKPLTKGELGALLRKVLGPREDRL